MTGVLAQLAEHSTFNRGVQGSIPWRPTRVPVGLRAAGTFSSSKALHCRWIGRMIVVSG
jgi:hypothetical protein